MTDDDLDRLLRDAVSSRARELVPDGTDRPALPTTRAAATGSVTPARRRWATRTWLAAGLATASAAAVVIAVVAVDSEAEADRRPPVPAGTVTASAVPDPSTPRPATTTPASPTSSFPRSEAAPPPDAETAAAATSTSTSTGSAAPDVAVYADCNDPTHDVPVARPTAISLACADNGENLTALTWSTWDADGATGTGTLVYRVCDPDCASGSTTRSVDGVVVTLSAPATGDGGGPVFTRLTLSPDPVSDGSYPLGTSP